MTTFTNNHKRFIRLVSCIFLSNFGAVSHASDMPFVNGQLLCSEKPDSTHSLIFGTKTGDEVVLTDVSFDAGPYVERMFACFRIVNDLQDNGLYSRTVTEFTYRELLPRMGKAITGRTTGKTAEIIHQACRQIPYCKVNFPFSWAWHNWKHVESDPPFPTGGKVCSERQQIRAQPGGLKAPRTGSDTKQTKVHAIPVSQSFKTWWAPVTRFSDEIVTLIKSVDNDLLLVASMVASIKEVERIKGELKLKNNLKMILLLDGPLIAESESFRQLLSLADDRLTILPVPRSPGLERPMHIKGAVAVKAGEFIFTSTNLRNSNNKSFLLDFGFSGKHLDVAQSLGSILASQVRTSCDNEVFLGCLLDVIFPQRSLDTHLFRRNFTQSCQFALSDQTFKKYFSSSPERYFMQTSVDLVDSAVIDFINSARSTLYLSSHQISHPGVINALIKKSKDLQRLKIVIGEREDFDAIQKTPLKDYLVDLGVDGDVGVHAKAILVDDRKVFFGTGNFTKTGLSNEREVFTHSENKSLVQFFRRFFDAVELVEENSKGIAQVGRCLTTEQINTKNTGDETIVWAPNYNGNGMVKAAPHRNDFFVINYKPQKSALFQVVCKQ